MRIRAGRPANVVRADYTRRIVATPDGLEFLDQAVTVVDDLETQEEIEVEHGQIGFLTAKMADAWDVQVEIPVNPGGPHKLGKTPILDPAPNAPGPKLRLTVGQAIQALTVYADTLRPPEPET